MADKIKCIIKQRDKVFVSLDRDITVSDNYPRLTNKPKINGITLDGDKTASELNLLSNRHTEYIQKELNEFKQGSFLLVLSENETAEKVALEELTRGKVNTAEKMPPDLQVGNYVFLLKGEVNGSNN